MNLKYVEAFYWVATLGSVSRAAQKQFITQSAMSSRIVALEEELGVLLFDRRQKTVHLTLAGERFLMFAERFLSLQREVKSELGAAPTEQTLRIGAIESVLHSWLTDWLRNIRLEHPSLALEITVETTPLLLEQVRRGTLDMVLAALPAQGEGLRSRALESLPMCLAGNATLHRKRRYRPADFDGLEVMTFQRGSQPHVALLDALRMASVPAPRIHNISSISAMVQLVEGGLGLATLPSAVVRRMEARHAMRELSTDIVLAPLPIHLTWRDDPNANVVRLAVDSVLVHARPKSGRVKT